VRIGIFVPARQRATDSAHVPTRDTNYGWWDKNSSRCFEHRSTLVVYASCRKTSTDPPTSPTKRLVLPSPS